MRKAAGRESPNERAADDQPPDSDTSAFRIPKKARSGGSKPPATAALDAGARPAKPADLAPQAEAAANAGVHITTSML